MSARNEVTGKEYQGKNVLRLLTAELENDYSDAHGWAGYGQWQTAGRQVRKGEHGTPCMTVVGVEKDDAGRPTKTAPRGFRVFHYDQTDEARPAEAMPATDPLAAQIDALVASRHPSRTVAVVADGRETVAEVRSRIAGRVSAHDDGTGADDDAVDVGPVLVADREPIDNSPDAKAARRQMFERLGWSVTK